MNNSRYFIVVFLAFMFPVVTLPAVSGLQAKSLWSDDAADNYSDRTAFQEGDILMIAVSESTEGRTENERDREKTVEVGGQAGDNTGGSTFVNDLAQWIPLFGATITGESTYESDRENDASGSLDTRMSVVVDQVKSNGILVLKGERKVKIDDEVQNLRFRGLARKDDVSADNVIQSDRIANAQIFYEGELGLRNGEPDGLIGKTWKFFKNVLFY